MKVLLHICCGPCTIYPLRVLREQGHEVSGYFFNPNIHPYSEFVKRRDTLAAFAKNAALPLAIDDRYELQSYLKGALDYGRDRCLFCYRMRLAQAFTQGGESGVDAVTTTLLYSKYQRHADIVAIASELSEEYDLPFLYEDFRVGWAEGVTESKKLNMYRQKYCGCVFSELETHKREGK
ncbi:MAG TPA: epoxyqueuosine reductase QueH [Syntrophorhabdales bacterium]|nr:epoxyqueuosine reductase QueH [Syntrophorhabdales bacterium]